MIDSFFMVHVKAALCIASYVHVFAIIESTEDLELF